MKKLTKAQEDYLNSNWDKYTLAELSEHTGCSLPTVRKFVKANSELKKEEVEAEQPKEEVPLTKANTQKKIRQDTRFLQHGVARNRGALVMTEGGAQMGDDFKKSRKRANPSYVHKPLGEDKNV